MPPSSTWSPPRAKVQLKLAIQRLRLLSVKKASLAKTTRREIAGQLEKGRIESARIKVEGVMGEDLTIELLEVLELYCELLLARFGLLETVKEVDPGVQEAVIGIIHAAPRTELKELHVLRDMLMSKGGRDFAIAAMDNSDNCVPERITSKLVVAAPPSELVDLYLFEIAKAYSVDWAPEGFPSASDPAPVPSTPTKVPLALATEGPSSSFPQTPPLEPAAAPRTVVIHSSLPSPGLTTPAAPPAAVAPAPTTKASEKKSEEDAFEALSKRFAELKRK